MVDANAPDDKDWPAPYGSEVNVHYPGRARRTRGVVVGWDNPMLWLLVAGETQRYWICDTSAAWSISPIEED